MKEKVSQHQQLNFQGLFLILTVVCKHCGAKKPLVKHKIEGITPKAYNDFQSDGWQYSNGAHGICPDCDIFTEKSIEKLEQ